MGGVVYDNNFALRVALGQVEGWTSFRKFGVNPSVTASTQDIWANGGTRVLPDAAGVATIVSSAINDDDGSTGAHQITMRGLQKLWHRTY